MGEDLRNTNEFRRQTRKNLEKGIVTAEPDKLQINDIMLGALVIIAAVISLTDFSFSIGSIANITALTIFLYLITTFVYRNRYAKGVMRGKREEEYICSLEEYRQKRDWIYNNNLAGYVPAFCTYYKKKELREYRESLLSDVEIPYEEYAEKYLKLPKRKIMALPLSIEAKKIILKCNAAKSIKLMPGMILNENGEYSRHKLIGKSGKQREIQDKRKNAITRAVYVLFGGLIVFDVIFNFSLQTCLQWLIRMLPVVLAIITGDDSGYCNISVTEVAFKKGQSNVINLFSEYLEEQKILPERKEEVAEASTDIMSDIKS
jgi:hypothetical protein